MGSGTDPLPTYRLFPQRMGCRPAQSCTKAEHWPCSVSGEAGAATGGGPSSAVVLEPAPAPTPVPLTAPLGPPAEGTGARPVQAPWGSSRARADRTSTSCRIFWASSRSPKSACSLRGGGACCWESELLAASRPSWGKMGHMGQIRLGRGRGLGGVASSGWVKSGWSREDTSRGRSLACRKAAHG